MSARGRAPFAYRAALRLLPAQFRREHAWEMEADFARLSAEAHAERGWAGALLCALRESADVARIAVKLRIARGIPVRSPGIRHAAEKRRGRSMDRLVTDVRHAVRSWARNPGFSVVALVVLALSIGAVTAIFSVVDAALLKPLPWRSPDRLVMVWQRVARIDMARGPLSWPTFSDLRHDAHSFSDMAAFRTQIGHTFSGDGAEVEQIAGAQSTGNLFTLLGVGAQLGRTLTEADAVAGAPRVIVLSDALWRRRYGALPGIIGKVLMVGDEAHTVIGVMPPHFDFPGWRDEYWTALRADDARQDRDTNYLQVIGRLAPGASLTSARAEMQALFDRMRVAYPDVFETNQPNLQLENDVVTADIRPTLTMLSFAVALLLLVACANLANLMLVRATVRGRELAVRSAMGAGRGRLVRQLLTESSLLAFAGGGLGVLLALNSTRLLLAFAPDSLPRRDAISVDTRALIFTLVVSALCAVLFGLLPALRISRQDTNASLREAGRGSTGRRAGRLQRLLVVAQLALAFVLLTGAALLLHSFLRLTAVPAGLDPQNVLSLHLAPPAASYREPARRVAYFTAVLERVGRLPGVVGTGGVWALPFSNGFASGRIVPEGASVQAGKEPVVGMYPVYGDWFNTMRIPLQRGRLLDARDNANAPGVVVVNQALADRLWPGQDPIGRRFRTGSVDEVDHDPWITVVGVVGNTQRFSLDEPVRLELYFPLVQTPWATDLWIVLRATNDPMPLVALVRAAVREIDPAIPITGLRTMTDRIATTVSEPRLRTFVVGCFAGLGGVLALVGIYGVMAFAVTQRTREIGVRMALGARRGVVLGHVVGQGARIIAVGLIIGAAGALAASRLVRGLLFRLSPLDPLTWTGVVLLLSTGAMLACLLPAVRASRISPLVALREE